MHQQECDSRLLGMKGTMSELELSILRQRSLEACAFHELAGHRLIYVHLSGSMRSNFISNKPSLASALQWAEYRCARPIISRSPHPACTARSVLLPGHHGYPRASDRSHSRQGPERPQVHQDHGCDGETVSPSPQSNSQTSTGIFRFSSPLKLALHLEPALYATRGSTRAS